MPARSIVAATQRNAVGAPVIPSPPAANLWINGNDPTKYTSGVDTRGRIVSTLTTSDANAYVSTALSSGNIRFKPSWNGEALYIQALEGMTLGNTSNFNGIHNGTDFDIYFLFKKLPLPVSTAHNVIAKTVGVTTINNQVGFYMAERNNTGMLNSLRFAIFNGAGGTTGPFDITSMNNTFIDNTWYAVNIKKNSSGLYMYRRPLGQSTYDLVGSDLSGSGLSSADAAAVFTVGGTSGVRTYFKQFLYFNHVLSAPESDQMEEWIDYELARQVTVEDAYVAFAWGQSNCYGKALNSAIAPDMVTGTDLGGYVYYSDSNEFLNHIGYWDHYITGTTTQPGNPTEHGAFLRFVKNMKDISGVTVYLIIRGVGSTKLLPEGSSGSWSALSPVNSGDLYPKYTDHLTTAALDELVHIERKNPIIRLLIPMIGETDAGNNVTNTYQKFYDEATAWIKAFVDYVQALGYSTAKMRVMWNRLHNSADAGWINVHNAQTDLMNNFLTDNPSYASKVKATTYTDTDNLSWSPPHYDAPAMDIIGQRDHNYAKDFINE